MQNFERVNGRPQLNTNGLIIKAYTADELFTREETRPIVCIMPSGQGKTYMNADIFRACLNAKYN